MICLDTKIGSICDALNALVAEHCWLPWPHQYINVENTEGHGIDLRMAGDCLGIGAFSFATAMGKLVAYLRYMVDGHYHYDPDSIGGIRWVCPCYTGSYEWNRADFAGCIGDVLDKIENEIIPKLDWEPPVPSPIYATWSDLPAGSGFGQENGAHALVQPAAPDSWPSYYWLESRDDGWIHGLAAHAANQQAHPPGTLPYWSVTLSRPTEYYSTVGAYLVDDDGQWIRTCQPYGIYKGGLFWWNGSQLIRTSVQCVISTEFL